MKVLMVASLMFSRVRRAAPAGVAFFVAPTLTLALFLILYNNIDDGRIILASMFLPSSALLALLMRRGRWGGYSAPARLGCACAIAAATALVALELIFPEAMPQEYARVMELAKGPDFSPKSGVGWVGAVFANGDQKRWEPAAAPAQRPEDLELRYRPGKEVEYYCYDPNERLRYVNIVRWNSRGYFDHDYSDEKGLGVFRIVFVGDSYVESLQVPLARSFHKLLEKELNRRAEERAGKDARRFEVIALGRSGTGQESNLDVLKNEAIRLNPDVVAFTLCANDFCDDDPRLRTERLLATGAVTMTFRGLARRNLSAMAFAVRRINELQAGWIRISPELLQWASEDIPRIETAWTYSLGKALEGNNFARANGLRFVLVYLGAELEVNAALDPSAAAAQLQGAGSSHLIMAWNPAKSVERVRRFCSAHNIELIMLLDPLIEAQRETQKLVFGDHYTFFGHEVAARELADALQRTAGRE